MFPPLIFTLEAVRVITLQQIYHACRKSNFQGKTQVFCHYFEFENRFLSLQLVYRQ